ncbi:MAG TPA: homocysteine S-methyltransferase family protein, partial [Patescibacteria group bacterium]
MKKIDILKTRLKNNERILLNGGTGTEILHRGFETSVPLWSAEVLLSHPSIVQNIHEDYIKAGAEIIVTNTFRTTERSFAKKGLSAKKATQITKLACTLAKNAIKKVSPKFDVFIAGSVAPLEDCYSPELTPSEEELRKEHYVYIKNLKEGGVDFILIETQITIKEIIAALDAAKKLHIPTAISLCVNNDLQLLSGETLEEIITLA